MEDHDESHRDPLRLNLRKQTQKLIDLHYLGDAHSIALKNAASRKALLELLSRLLLLPQYTMVIATFYRPILLDLCARWLDQTTDSLQKLETLSLLLGVHPEVYPVLYVLSQHPELAYGPLSLLLSSIPARDLDSRLLQRILLAYYRILEANPSFPRTLGWPLSPLSELIASQRPDKSVLLLAIKCYALQTGMMEIERVKLESRIVGDVKGVNCLTHFSVNLDGTVREVDGWVLPILEAQRVSRARDALYDAQDFYTYDENDSSEPIHPAELSPLVANIEGVFMLRASVSATPPSQLINTPTTAEALRHIALRLSLQLPILLTSSPSSGKALLISHVAQILYPDSRNHVVTIHLADTSLDPRSLLGSYISSPIRPGTFEWKDGVLVRAMQEGKWVVFEDIDRATIEVLSIVKPLVESLGADKVVGGHARLEVPSRGTVEAKGTFAVFATRSIELTRKGAFPAPTFFGAHKFYEVVVGSPTANDLRLIVDTKFPHLSGAPAQGLINLWGGVRSLGNPASTRGVGLRELERFCTRVSGLLPSNHQSMGIDRDAVLPVDLSHVFPNPTVREDVFLEARDIFFGAGATTTAGRTHLAAIAQLVAEYLGLSDERRDWLMHHRTPEYEVAKDVNGRVIAVHAGRTRLPARAARAEIASPVMRPFAMHRPAVSLMARLATAISLAEPILLTGETGTGKTSVVTHLASLLRRPLISLNLSNQTESSDILGGFKPVDARIPGSELQQRFLDLFGGTFSRKKNARFEESVRKAVQERKWRRATGLWLEATKMARGRIQAKQAEEDARELEGRTPRKRRKTDGSGLQVSMDAWEAFEHDVQTFEVQHVQGKSKFAFAFVEGPLVKALRNGDWILLDEVNLATPETLESISGLLHGPTASITLTEQGSLEPIPRHSEFRLFACMNPATDVGKKDLPSNIRSRFTEIDVPPPDADKETLLTIVAQYIGSCAVGDKGAIMDVAEFYSAVKRLADERQIADGSNHRPHFSMRTLTRALTFSADMVSSYSLRRALWEGCLMAFTMVLDGPGAAAVTALAQKHLLAGVRNPKSLLAKEPLPPGDPSVFVKFGPFYLERGPVSEDLDEDYIMTPSVETKLIDLARIIAAKRFPVLIEGPTSSGKTSSIEYLAKRTGHRFVRINNHEHTDIQEYIGTYVSDPATGKLVFKEGLLVRALRQGDWIVLDELNLAPTEVLEALNRLLDDNRELVIPETQEVVRPHPHFMLFATQNPPGLYAGRKVLSRAFRNRFLEVHFEDVPQAELETILCQRCRIAPSYGQRIVAVFRELQKRRQSSRVFESKHGFATLRDLFRWAGRDAMSYEELAVNGYMLLAERTRRDDDKVVVKDVIESIMKVRIDESTLYDIQNPNFDSAAFLGCPLPSSSRVVWTSAMQRLFVLTARALRFNEPVLLVGETGCGKTSACQLYAEVLGRTLRSVNCHQNTETADLIGGLRPIRNRAAMEAETIQKVITALSQLGISNIVEDATALTLSIDGLLQAGALSVAQEAVVRDLRARLQRLSAMFQWCDGPLVKAMQKGDVFLLDEISLADDSVLERLNSVLESGRTIVLAERGGEDEDIPAIKAVDEFKFVATMNPGGDYGKKELSPALRNRFTEIWVPAIIDRRDLESVVQTLWEHDALRSYTTPVLDYTEWLCAAVGDRAFANLRDILAWVAFSNAAVSRNGSTLSADAVFHHAAEMTFLDGLEAMPQLSAYSKEALGQFKSDALSKLHSLVSLPSSSNENQALSYDPIGVRFGTFSIPRGPLEPTLHSFSLEAPTARDNVLRVVRACQLPKPIMLEGSPGVGKTSLVAALANLCGHHLCRINLSDQTDLVDLFGSDLPVEGGEPGQFAWKDAEFLRALQEGHWVLLDEMNLAPQSVLEGLNAVLDHRGTVYIPELGRSFVRHPSFRVFAAQNPLHQGGGRKGLPKSFLNRFTKVYVQEMSSADLLLICRNLFPNYPSDLLEKMITYMNVLNEETMVKRSFAREGAPWEFNLRDVIRWTTLLCDSDTPAHPSQYLSSAILQRFRTREDRSRAHRLFLNIFTGKHDIDRPPITISPSYLQIGNFCFRRSGRLSAFRAGRILQESLSAFESLGTCVSRGWLAILTGPKNSGKTTLVRTMANMLGKTLHEVPVNNTTDASDILGSFEETDLGYRTGSAIRSILDLLEDASCTDFGVNLHVASDYAASLRSISSQTSRAAFSQVVDTLTRIIDALSSLPDPYHNRCLAAREEVRLLSESKNCAGRLEWVDGPLVRALKEGHWLLLDGANLCNASVLDRLNSLCEIGGSLTLNERGTVNGEVQVLRPHPDFRLFMSADGQHGELSRAMRNRGIEIALTTDFNPEDCRRIIDHLGCSPRAGLLVADYKGTVILHSRLRRGLCDTPTSLLDSVSWDSERLLQRNSANGHAAGLAISMTSAPNTPMSRRAQLFFLAASVIPDALAYLSRFLPYCHVPESTTPSNLRAFLDMVECSDVSRTIIQSRKNISHSFPNTSDVLLAQPLYVDSTAAANLQSEDNIVVLQYLRLLTAATSDYAQYMDVENTTVVNRTQRSAKTRPESKASADAKALVGTIKTFSTEFLKQPDFTLGHADVSTVMDIVAFGRYLQGATEVEGTFNFSLAFAVVDWIQQSVNEFHSSQAIFTELSTAVARLKDAVSLSTGIGLIDLWMKLSLQCVGLSNHVEIDNLERADRHLAASTIEPKLRAQILDLMTLWSLPGIDDEDHRETLGELTSHLQQRMIEVKATEVSGAAEVDLAQICVQLQALYVISVNHLASKPILHDLLDLSYSDEKVSLAKMVAYKQMLWAVDAGERIAPLYMRLLQDWFRDTWDGGLSAEIHSPSALCHPIELLQSVLSCDDTARSLNKLADYEHSLARRLTILAGNLAGNMTRWTQLRVLLGRIVLLVITSITSNVTAEAWQQSPAGMHDLPISNVLAILDNVQDERILGVYQKHLRPTLLALAAPINENSYLVLGHGWIGLSRFLLELYVPDIPVDPVVVQQCSHQFWTDQRMLLQSELSLHREYEDRTVGRRSNLAIRFLSQELLLAERRVPPEAKGIYGRSDMIKLHAYWTEVTQFLTQAASPSKTNAIISALGFREPDALTREQMVQDSTAAFSRRLDSVYPDFADVSGPLQVALLQQRLGLRFIADASTTSSDPEAHRVAESLVSFPSIEGSETLRTDVSSSTTSFSLVLSKLAATAADVASGVERGSCLPELEMIYEQSLGLWLIDKARAEEAEREAQSLYRHKTESSDPENEAELEEREFLALFPEYGDLLDDDSTSSAHQVRRQPKALVDSDDVKRLSTLHLYLFGYGHLSLADPHAVGEYWELRKSLVHELLSSHASHLPETLDLLSRPYQISLLIGRLSELRGTPIVRRKPFNFYADSNVPEINNGLEVLRNMVTRLVVLIQEWPEQMVLQHLKARCDAILDLDILSPVAKVLSAIEQLLLQMEDWEMYANRENTLKAYQHDLAVLVVSWRRLELASWQGLLRTQAEVFAEGASEYWFRLYEATVRGVASAMQEEVGGERGALAKYLDGLVPLLDAYVGSTPLGQYAQRLRYLQAFESYCAHQCTFQIGPLSTAFQRAHRVLRFTRAYYSQFASRVTSSLSAQQEALEKEIRGFIKLASWKDINVHALKQSAQKTHRQLYKCVRKFKEILRQPVTPLLVPSGAGPEESTPAPHVDLLRLTEGVPTLPPFSVDSSELAHLANLERTFRNFQYVVQGRISSLITSLSPADVEDLSSEIISTLQSLASSSVPANVTGEHRDKAHKALLVRKRKAWSDLLKELKRIGLATNMKPEVLEQQCSARWLREQPVITDSWPLSAPFEKSEAYLLRLSKLLPDLRATLSNHNQDIGTRELQRGTSLVESAFSLAIEARKWCVNCGFAWCRFRWNSPGLFSFVDATEQHMQLQNIVRRLHMISQQPRIVASGSDMHIRVVRIKEDLGRFISALEEMHTTWRQYLAELPNTEVLPAAADGVMAAISASKALFTRVADVTMMLKMTSTPVLLEDEATVLAETLDHVRAVGELLRGWENGPNIVALFAKPVLDWLMKRDAFSAAQFEHAPHNLATDNTADLIDRLLLCAQGTLAIPSPPAKDESDMYDTQDRFLRDYNRLIMQVTRSLKLEDVSALLTSVVDSAVAASPQELGTRLARVMPFLDTYLELTRVQLSNHCAWTKALFKLDYVICTVMRTVAQDGFCKPPDAGETEAGNGAMEDAGGVGLGEGSGKENVSKEIEDESQVEGLQGEDGEDDDVERAEEGNALEMSEDIGGKMQDVDQTEGEEDEEEDDGESDEEPEEQLGDLDAADPSAVDEKLWGDESGPEDSKQDGGKTAEDHSTQKQESETVAKEDEGRPSKEKEKQKEQAQEEGTEGQEAEEPLPEDAAQDEAMDEGDQEQQDGAPLDDFVPEANTLELPEDLDFGKENGKEPELDEDIDMGDEDVEEELDGPEEEKPGDGVDDGAEEDDAMDVEENPTAVPENAAQPENGSEDIVDGATAQPDLHAGAGQDSGETGDQAMADTNQGQGSKGSAASGEAGGEEESEEREAAAQEATVQEERSLEKNNEASTTAAESVEEGKDTTGSARSRQGAAPMQTKPQPLQNNPLRNLGDALREISQRMDEILEGEGPQERQEQQMDTSGGSQLEYLRPEEDKGSDEMQALGPAQQEDVAKLNELKFLDEDMEPTDSIPPVDDDAPQSAPELSSDPPQSAMHIEPTAQSTRDDMKSALTQNEIRAQTSRAPPADRIELPSSDKSIPAEDEEHAAQQAVELALRQWQADGQPSGQAEDMWRKYESLTHDLSYALCEQLRLILEPTMATRLRGDYRTGKRLNMKKIIPYIASEFTKDKIWLRRTRPSTREYQVLVALDDSRSMAESHSVHLALQTLALVARALGRLEVGDVALARFGAAVDVLHGFDAGPFTDQAGARVMRAFRFDQKATQVLALLETSLTVLEQARERRAASSSSAADLWQLEIIISDGICQDHERLRTVLRRAEEQRVMVVFIVLDSLHANGAGAGGGGENSILSMNQVAYKMVDGRMDLQVERYLDTFPFEYYVVLRNVEALPDVLAGTLTQFFERVAEA
ncbi:midasin [Trametes gibbosa]|nr:midasin [Trametes gibbosa]